MVRFVLALIFALIGIILIVRGSVVTSPAGRYQEEERRLSLRPFGAAFLFIAVLIGIWSLFYRLDVSEAAVVRSFSGKVTGTETNPGLHTKAPWDKVVKFDVKNQAVSMYGPCNGDLREGAKDCAIGANTLDNASAAIDITVNYSLDPSKIEQIYTQYRTQDNLMTRVILPGIRSAGRDAPTKYATAVIRQSRGPLTADITKDLESRFGAVGIIIDRVDLRGIGLDKEVEKQLNQIQAARAEVEKERQRLEQAKINAERVKTDAKAQSDADQIQRCGAVITPAKQVINGVETDISIVEPVANKDCQNRLNEQVLTRAYIDMLAKKGNSVLVVPPNVNGLLNLGSGR